MKTYPRGRTVTALLAVGGAALILCGAGCHQSPPPAPLPSGVTKVDSSKPPPGMEALYQRSQAAKAGAGQSTAGATGH